MFRHSIVAQKVVLIFDFLTFLTVVISFNVGYKSELDRKSEPECIPVRVPLTGQKFPVSFGGRKQIRNTKSSDFKGTVARDGFGF